MDFSIASSFNAYTQIQSSASYGVDTRVRSDVAVLSRSNSASTRLSNAVLSEREGAPAPSNPTQTVEETKKKREMASESLPTGIQFEYEGQQLVMKVHGSKGELIYQVPSKGRLALIQAEVPHQSISIMA